LPIIQEWFEDVNVLRFTPGVSLLSDAGGGLVFAEFLRTAPEITLSAAEQIYELARERIAASPGETNRSCSGEEKG
jgi:hypothetical protein